MRVQCTTGGPCPLVIVSGPVVRNSASILVKGRLSARPSSELGDTAARYRLVRVNIGLGVAPGNVRMPRWAIPDATAISSPSRPPEGRQPVGPIHVTNGLKPEDSAVSMYPPETHIQFNFGDGGEHHRQQPVRLPGCT